MTSFPTNFQDDLIELPIAQFYYPGGLDDLIVSQANHLAISDVLTELPSDTFVVNIAKDKDGKGNDRFFVQVGWSKSASPMDVRASEVWPTWTDNNTVFAVKWLTNAVQVPSVYFANFREMSQDNELREVMSYALLNSRKY